MQGGRLKLEGVRRRTWENFTAHRVSGFSRVMCLASISPSPIPNSFLLVYSGGGNGKEERVTFPNY